MELDAKEKLRLVLDHAGFTVPDDELEGMMRVHEVNQARLALLHAADLDDEEVAGTFSPKMTGEGWNA